MLLEQIILELLREQEASVDDLAEALRVDRKVVDDIVARLFSFGLIEGNLRLNCN